MPAVFFVYNSYAEKVKFYKEGLSYANLSVICDFADAARYVCSV